MESVIMVICVIILAIPTTYFVITIVSIGALFLTLPKAHIIIDSALNLNILSQGEEYEMGSFVAFIFSLLSSIVFGLLLPLFFRIRKWIFIESRKVKTNVKVKI